jgi:5-methylcytosine-specific restriction endonuclease McrA
MRHTPNLKNISDDALLRRVSEVLGQARRAEVELVALIAEVETRRLYAREAASSMFAWCTDVLHLSEYEAYLRIAVARASREHPVLLTMLDDGRLHLSGIALLARHLTPENRDQVLERAAGRTHCELKELVAELAPRPDAPARIRKLPARKAEASRVEGRQLGTHQVVSSKEDSESDEVAAPGAPPLPDGTGARTGTLTVTEGAPVVERTPLPAVSAPALREFEPPSATVEPLAPARFRVQFTADAELRDMLERLQALMRSSVPDGDLAGILKVAVAEKLERLEAKRFAKTKKPRKSLAETDTRPKSRHIPAAVRRAVEKRDGGRCTYRDTQGRRCGKRHDLEFHHREPFGCGGDHRPENLALMCGTQNALMAEHDYGKEVMWRHRRSPRPSPSRTPSVPVSRRRGHS